MTAFERLAISLAPEDLTQNTYRNSSAREQVLNYNPYRVGLVLRNAGGPNGGGDIRLRYKEEERFQDVEAVHVLPPGGQLTPGDISDGSFVPKQSIQAVFPSSTTILTVAEWERRLPQSVTDVARNLGFRVQR